jgi:hypothetical protein
VTNEPTGDGVESRKYDERTHGALGRKSKTRRTNPRAERSTVENATNEPTDRWVDSRKQDKRTRRSPGRESRHDERTHRSADRKSKTQRTTHGHRIASRKRDERTHRLRVKHVRTQRTNPSAVESNVESSQNRTRQIGSVVISAKRSQFRPNRILSHDLSTIFAHRKWSSLVSAVGSCGTGQPASERSAVCIRPSAGGGPASGPRRKRHAVKLDKRIHRPLGRESGTEHNETNRRPLD